MRRRHVLACVAPFVSGFLTQLSLPGPAAAVCARDRNKKKKKPGLAYRRPIPWLVGGMPNIQAPAALVVAIDDNRDLFARRADVARPIASISKLAAALVVMSKDIDLEQVTTIQAGDADAARGGARSRLLTGMSLSNLDLLHAALLGSDNRAVCALGRAAGLDAGQLTAEMNRKARALGLMTAQFREPTGLSRENIATPRDCVRMLSACLEHPRLASVLAKLEYEAHPVSRPAIRYTATYRPAIRPNAHILAGKTGYNDYARYCLVAIASIDGRRFGLAFLGAEGKLTRFGDFARAADWLVTHKPHRKTA